MLATEQDKNLSRNIINGLVTAVFDEQFFIVHRNELIALRSAIDIMQQDAEEGNKH